MSKSIESKNIALKLVNKYADSYKMLTYENKSLKDEINDLRLNINLNKEIISTFYNSNNKTYNNDNNNNNNNNNKDEKFIFLFNKLKEENKNLYKTVERISNEKNSLYSTLLQTKENVSNGLSELKKQNEGLKSKIFLLENEMKKKNYKIFCLEKTIYNFKNDICDYEKEILIIEPNKALLEIHRELELYKKIYLKLIKNFKKNEISLIKYERIIQSLQENNSKLKKKYKNSIIKSNREKETFLNILNSTNRNKTSDNISLENKINNIIPDNPQLKSRLKLNDNNFYGTINSLDELGEILKNVGLTKSEFDKMTKSEKYYKLTDVIEFLYKLLIDKNITNRLLENENADLVNKNFNLNKENMTLQNELKKYKKLDDKSEDGSININKSDFSNISNNNILNKSLINYQKLLQQQKENDEFQFSKDNMNLESSTSTCKNKITENNNIDVLNTSNFSNKNQINNNNAMKNIETLESVTSSEFRDGIEYQRKIDEINKKLNTNYKEINNKNISPNKKNNNKNSTSDTEAEISIKFIKDE